MSLHGTTTGAGPSCRSAFPPKRKPRSSGDGGDHRLRHLILTAAGVVVVFTVLSCPSASGSPALPAPPPVSAPVVDRAGILSVGTVRVLGEQLGEDNRSGVAQIAVLTGDAIAEPIATYADAVFDHWRNGDARYDDGVLVVVAVDDRQTRIQTGSGLGARLSDAAATHIVTTDALPELRKGDADAGVVMTVVAIRRDLGLPVSSVVGSPGAPATPPRPLRRDQGRAAVAAAISPSSVGSGPGSSCSVALPSWRGAARAGHRARGTHRAGTGAAWPAAAWAAPGMAGGGFGGGASGGGGATGSW